MSDELKSQYLNVVDVLETMSRLQRLIAIKILPQLSDFYGLPSELDYEISKEFNKCPVVSK